MVHQQKKRICLVSLPGLVQEATRAALMLLEDVTLVGIISGALSATALLPQLQPDLLVVDANLPEEEVEALLRWTQEHTPGLAMRGHDHDLAAAGSGAVLGRRRCDPARPVVRPVGDHAEPAAAHPRAGWPVIAGQQLATCQLRLGESLVKLATNHREILAAWTSSFLSPLQAVRAARFPSARILATDYTDSH